jgi:hypothetical protein
MMIKKIIGSILLIGLFFTPSPAQMLIDWKEIGQLKTRNAKDIKGSTWSIGGETLDRDYTDYHSYKRYLGQLGAKRIRLQGGWAKCEKEKGKYNFAWLDSIIPDAVSRGVIPWVELSYGNPIYEGGGEAKLAGHIPNSPEALQAWDSWVRAMVIRYKGQVIEWEIWNEPDINKEHTGTEIGEFYIRTAQIVKEIQPKARLLALGLAGIGRLEFVKDFMETLKQQNALGLIDVMTYHGYAYNPDTSYPAIEKLRQLVWSYKPSVIFMQGENGAPSTPKAVTIGALREQDWSELTQAKWDLRRMLGDNGRGIATNLFTISDIHYGANDHMIGINTKGLLKTNPDKTIERPKLAFYVAQRVFSLFDEEIILDTESKVQSNGTNQSFFAYKHFKKGFSLITVWQNEEKPAELYPLKSSTLTIENTKFKQPVLIDLISGKIYEISKKNWKKEGKKFIFTEIPIPDYPILITDKANID